LFNQQTWALANTHVNYALCWIENLWETIVLTSKYRGEGSSFLFPSANSRAISSRSVSTWDLHST
jgi:hypothetical protein